MSTKKRRTVTTIESHQVWIVKRPKPDLPDVSGDEGVGMSEMQTPEQAAEHAGVSQSADPTMVKRNDGGAK